MDWIVFDFLLMSVVSVGIVFAGIALFKQYSRNKEANKTLPLQEKTSTTGYLAAAIVFWVIAVILAVLIIWYLIEFGKSIS